MDNGYNDGDHDGGGHSKVKVDEDYQGQVDKVKVDEDANQDKKVKLDQVGDEMDLNHHQSRKKVCIICMQKANRELGDKLKCVIKEHIKDVDFSDLRVPSGVCNGCRNSFFFCHFIGLFLRHL